MAKAGNARRQRTAKRKFISYAESSTEDEIDVPPKQLRRSARQRIDYRESSTDTSSDSGSNSSNTDLRTATSHRPRSLLQTKFSRPLKRSARLNTKHNPIKRSKADTTAPSNTLPTQWPSRKPIPWQTLPYEILFQIFRFASEPLYDRFSRRPTGSIEWLLRISTLSKSFHEAAISALLYSPPLIPSDRALRLIACLEDHNRLTIDYRKKVRRLDIDVKQLLRKNGPDLVEFVRHTPQLKDLTIYSALDYTSTVVLPFPSRAKWSYPPELFNVLDQSIRLRSFEFNGRFPNTQSVVSTMSNVLNRPSFTTLRSLTLLNFVDLDTGPTEDGDVQRISVASAVSSLSNLENLTMRNCSILNRVLFSRLPQVAYLSLVNCGEITSHDLSEYLETNGRALRHLSLVGNQGLSLAFAQQLEQDCPQLRVFHMNFTYADRSAYHDVEPHFDELLPMRILPTWPQSLEVIELIQLRRLNVEIAKSFLNTLLDAGESLKRLRVLRLKIILKEGWRERSALRTKYTTKLEDMFLRRPSSAHFRSPTLRSSDPSSGISRPSSSHSNSSASSFAGAKSTTRRKSARVARQVEKDTKPNGTELSADRPYTNRAISNGPRAIQGMCNVVRLQVDDQRPTEFQFNEDHFLNEDDDADDGEWNGTDRIVEPGGYAW